MNKETIGIINFIDSKEFEIIVGEFTKSHEKYYIDKILYDKDPENNIVKYTRHDLYREGLSIIRYFKDQFIVLVQNNEAIDNEQKEILMKKLETLFK